MSIDPRDRNEYLLRAANEAIQLNRDSPSDQLLALNPNIWNPNLIYVGQVIRVR